MSAKFFGAWANYRQQWPRPFLKQGQNPEEWAICHLHEQINGQIAKTREYMKTLGEE